MLPDFKADLLVPQVRLDAKADFLQTRLEIPHVIALGSGDIDDHRRLRREPRRHGPGVVLDEDAEEALEGAEDRPMEHHRAILGSFERFLGILIEHYAGAMPLWLEG